jgi:hypothetical protein
MQHSNCAIPCNECPLRTLHVSGKRVPRSLPPRNGNVTEETPHPYLRNGPPQGISASSKELVVQGDDPTTQCSTAVLAVIRVDAVALCPR